LSFLSTVDSQIIDASGEVVLLRGTNFRGYHYGDQDLWKTTHTDGDYQNIKSWGFNAVRLLISWSKIETTKGVYNERYFAEYVDRDINWAKKYGLYIILDMHQYKWGAKWNGNGSPDWAIAQYPSTEEGRLSAVEDFWKSQELRTHFVDTWKYVAARYANEPTVAGYDVLNEPWAMFDKSKSSPSQISSTLGDFYEQVIDAIRTVDANHIVFVDPYAPAVAPIRRIDRPNLVWASHFYAYVYQYYGAAYCHDNATLLENYLKPFYDTLVMGYQQPLWIGEFGMEMWVTGSDTWTSESVQLFQKYQLGWAWWVYWKSDQPDMSLLDSKGTPRQYFLQFLMNPTLAI
jgi:endoglycosylceramidase